MLTSAALSTNQITVSVTTPSLVPVHSNANRALYHVWSISNIDFQVSDTDLGRMLEWNESPSCNMVSLDWYQNARLTASADITSDDITFTATNILPLIADKVGTISCAF